MTGQMLPNLAEQGCAEGTDLAGGVAAGVLAGLRNSCLIRLMLTNPFH
jgi:hypothetical protein